MYCRLTETLWQDAGGCASDGGSLQGFGSWIVSCPMRKTYTLRALSCAATASDRHESLEPIRHFVNNMIFVSASHRVVGTEYALPEFEANHIFPAYVLSHHEHTEGDSGAAGMLQNSLTRNYRCIQRGPLPRNMCFKRATFALPLKIIPCANDQLRWQIPAVWPVKIVGAWSPACFMQAAQQHPGSTGVRHLGKSARARTGGRAKSTTGSLKTRNKTTWYQDSDSDIHPDYPAVPSPAQVRKDDL